MPSIIIPIVEGHGEVSAVPILLRRLAYEKLELAIEVKKPIRIPKQKIQKAGELERALDLASQKADGSIGILVLFDADDDCPFEIAQQLLQRANAARPNVQIQVVIAKAEYEAWFLGALGSLVPPEAAQLAGFEPRESENVRGAKEKFEDLMGIFYSETVDQAAYSSKFDLSMAQTNCPSFDKLCRSLRILLEAE